MSSERESAATTATAMWVLDDLHPILDARSGFRFLRATN
jgi:hypothetical protein